MLLQNQFKKICSNFSVYGDFIVAIPFGTGHINDTYQVTYDQGGIRLHYILQRLNKVVFPHPEQIMENIDRVTQHILGKIRKDGLEAQKRTICLIRTLDQSPYFVDECGDFWRMYIFVENARTYDIMESEKQVYEASKAFGEFLKDVTDLPGERLHETIVNFHNTPKRLEALEKSISIDKCGRAKAVMPEIDFVMNRRDDVSHLLNLNASGDIPERITHNDTKLNNILIDDLTGVGSCVIDLDTVMPGLSLYDFGDMVRTGSSPAKEDETDLSKVFMRFNMYEALVKGFLSSTESVLTPAERENLPFSAKLITLETGIRFLTDYLDGDNYFKIKHETHNLDRCRNQFKLVESIEEQIDKMKSILS